MYHDGLGELGQDKKKLRLATVSFGFFYSYHDGFEKRVEIKIILGLTPVLCGEKSRLQQFLN